MINKLKSFSRSIKKELLVYKSVLRDSRTPLAAKMLLALAIGYLLFPFDIIPDFIPVAGLIDDLIIVPLLFYAAIKLTPQYIIEENRKKYEFRQA